MVFFETRLERLAQKTQLHGRVTVQTFGNSGIYLPFRRESLPQVSSRRVPFSHQFGWTEFP